MPDNASLLDSSYKICKKIYLAVNGSKKERERRGEAFQQSKINSDVSSV